MFVRDGFILLGERKEHDGECAAWTAPGGKCEEGETWEAGLRREVLEETGIGNFKIQDYIGEVRGDKNNLVPIFLCVTFEEPQLTEPDKFNIWKWFSLDDFLNDRIGPSRSLAARKLVQLYLKLLVESSWKIQQKKPIAISLFES